MNSSTNTPITKKITLAHFACLCLSIFKLSSNYYPLFSFEIITPAKVCPHQVLLFCRKYCATITRITCHLVTQQSVSQKQAEYCSTPTSQQRSIKSVTGQIVVLCSHTVILMCVLVTVSTLATFII